MGHGSALAARSVCGWNNLRSALRLVRGDGAVERPLHSAATHRHLIPADVTHRRRLLDCEALSVSRSV